MQTFNLGLNLDLTSGHPILEFTNTVSNHASEHPGEMLFQYEDLLTWIEKIGLMREEQVKKLGHKASAQPDEAEAALAKALELREAVYRIFVAKVKEKSPTDSDLAILNSILTRLTGGAQVVYRSGRFEWGWNFDENALEAPLSILALLTVDLLTSEHVKRIGQCADEEGCGWLFVDTSKNHSRRWCDINDCGNRAKQRRYQQRARGQKS